MEDDEVEPEVWTVEFLPFKPVPSKPYPGFVRDLVGLLLLFVVSVIIFSL